MTQALERPLTFDEFIEWYPNDGRLYELIDGVVVEVKPTPAVSGTGCHCFANIWHSGTTADAVFGFGQ